MHSLTITTVSITSQGVSSIAGAVVTTSSIVTVLSTATIAVGTLVNICDTINGSLALNVSYRSCCLLSQEYPFPFSEYPVLQEQ